jgi:hypothetical protein
MTNPTGALAFATLFSLAAAIGALAIKGYPTLIAHDAIQFRCILHKIFLPVIDRQWVALAASGGW